MRTGIFHGGKTSYLPAWATVVSVAFFLVIVTKAIFLSRAFLEIDYVNEYLIRNLDKNNWTNETTPYDPQFNQNYDLELFPLTLYVDGACDNISDKEIKATI